MFFDLDFPSYFEKTKFIAKAARRKTRIKFVAAWWLISLRTPTVENIANLCFCLVVHIHVHSARDANKPRPREGVRPGHREEYLANQWKEIET